MSILHGELISFRATIRATEKTIKKGNKIVFRATVHRGYGKDRATIVMERKSVTLMLPIL